MQEEVTLNRLKTGFSSIDESINWALAQVEQLPDKPIKPTLSKEHTSEDALDYSKKL